MPPEALLEVLVVVLVELAAPEVVPLVADVLVPEDVVDVPDVVPEVLPDVVPVVPVAVVPLITVADGVAVQAPSMQMVGGGVGVAAAMAATLTRAPAIETSSRLSLLYIMHLLPVTRPDGRVGRPGRL
jgi:hypothetical protein